MPILTIVVLIAAIGRLSVLISVEVNDMSMERRRQAAATLTPGSFNGIGVDGAPLRSATQEFGYRLLFRLRATHLEGDRAYWNKVIQNVKSEIPIHYWGICDAGHACDQSQERALFTVVSFLEPYQMRIVATATADGSALLYGPTRELEDSIVPADDATSTAELISNLIY